MTHRSATKEDHMPYYVGSLVLTLVGLLGISVFMGGPCHSENKLTRWRYELSLKYRDYKSDGPQIMKHLDTWVCSRQTHSYRHVYDLSLKTNQRGIIGIRRQTVKMATLCCHVF